MQTEQKTESTVEATFLALEKLNVGKSPVSRFLERGGSIRDLSFFSDSDIKAIAQQLIDSGQLCSCQYGKQQIQ